MKTLATIVVALLIAAAACASTREICTPANSGYGDSPRLVRRDFPEVTPKNACNPHVQVIRSNAELQRAYEEAGVAIASADGGSSPPDAIALPTVDFSRETVVFREATDRHPLSWVISKDGTITIGSQACDQAGTNACTIQVFAVETIAAGAETHECASITCG